MRLILHIGTHKTGTTSIQSFLETNRIALQSQGFGCPLSLSGQNRKKLGLYCVETGRCKDMYRRAKVSDPSGIPALRKGLEQSFRQEMESLVDMHTIVISNEHLHSRCLFDEDLERLKELIGGHFTETSVVVYVRPQLDLVASLYTTSLRYGQRKTLDEFAKARARGTKSVVHDLARALRLWSRHFGEENITVRLFDEAKRLEHGVVSDFVTVMNLDEHESSFVYPPRRNRSLSVTGQELLRRYNILNASLPTSSPVVSQKVENAILEHCSGRGLMPSRDVVLKFVERFGEGNQWVSQNWFPGKKNPFEVDWDQWETATRVPPPPITVEFVEELMRILRHEEEAPQHRPGTSIGALLMSTAENLTTLASAIEPKERALRRRLTSTLRRRWSR